MRLRRPRVPPALRLWFGVFGAPAAWVGMFVFGFGTTQAACNAGGSRWGIPVSGWTTAATVIAAAIALLAELSAISVFRATRGAGNAPPVGRIHFLAVAGMTVGILFLFIILMSGLGALSLPNCHQG